MASPNDPMDPYQPARASLNDVRPEKAVVRSFADRVSLGLAMAGALATVSSVLLSASIGRGMPHSRRSILVAAGLLIELAFIAHAVGIGVIFAAPRGSRTRGLVTNGLAMAFLLAYLVAGLVAKHQMQNE
jgi:hypothetical protein